LFFLWRKKPPGPLYEGGGAGARLTDQPPLYPLLIKERNNITQAKANPKIKSKGEILHLRFRMTEWSFLVVRKIAV
jgi:hypothetical protein